MGECFTPETTCKPCARVYLRRRLADYDLILDVSPARPRLPATLRRVSIPQIMQRAARTP